MKKVLIVCHDNLLYGASKSLIDWVENVNYGKYKLIFLIPHGKGDLKERLELMGHAVLQERYYQPIKKYNNKKIILKIKNLFRSMLCGIFNPLAVNKISHFCKINNVRIIHSNTYVTPIGAQIAIRNNIPHIWHIREFMEEDHMMTYIYRDCYMKKLKSRSYPIYISDIIKQKYYQSFNERGTVIYDQVAYDLEYKHSDKKDSKLFNIMIAGKITKNKGQMDAVRAVEILIKKGFNIKLYICGDGLESAQIVKYCNEQKLNNNIIIKGYVNDLLEMRKIIDIAFVCSKMEALGRVTVENMYYENLTVGANCGCTKELLEENHGILYEYGDVESLVEATEYVMNNWSEMSNVVMNAKKYAIGKFSRPIYKQIFEIYDEALL